MKQGLPMTLGDATPAPAAGSLKVRHGSDVLPGLSQDDVGQLKKLSEGMPNLPCPTSASMIPMMLPG